MMFELHRLGWHDFQRLCSTILRECLGQTVQSFLDSNDGGRDGAFVGEWHTQSSESVSGQFVVQCKFSSRPSYTLRLSDVDDEVAKAKRLAQRGLCDSYILMTNSGVSGRFQETFTGRLRDVGVAVVLVYGSDWICQQIRENKRLRMLVPRVYGLGDISEILDERAYKQAGALLASLREDLARVVMTEPYYRAATALQDHGFVLLLGEPASGKTTIASMLAMTALDQWGAMTLKLDQPVQVVDHWNPDLTSREHRQFFWIDDAFGATQYEPPLVHGWNHAFAQVKTMLRGGARIVMTSRDYIYNRARFDLKNSSFPLLAESQVAINVNAMTLDEKRQILYNHIKLGTQPQRFRSAIKPHLEAVASHPRFAPEAARRLGDRAFTKNVRADRDGLIDFVENQREFLVEVLTGLDTDSKAGLALIFMRSGVLESPIRLSSGESDALDRLGSTLGTCAGALAAMTGSLVKHVLTADAVAVWQFKHPTIGDAFAELLLRNPELLGIYVCGAPFRQLLNQVTCGDVGLENAVRVPRPLFPEVLERLREAHVQPKDARGASGLALLDYFLAHRCGREFLECYLSTNPEILDRITSPWIAIVGETGVAVVIRLSQFNLLPEGRRRKFLDTVIGHAFEYGDPEVVTNKSIRQLFRGDEWAALMLRVQQELSCFLKNVREFYQEEYSEKDDPGEVIQPFKEVCSQLESEFSNNASVRETIQEERARAEIWVTRKLEDQPGEPDYDLETFRSRPGPPTEAHRSVFDDVDS
jgi:hypothetical protein